MLFNVRRVVRRYRTLSFISALFVILTVLGILPTLVLTWKASGWQGEWWLPVLWDGVWQLHGEAEKWHQLLAVATVALTAATFLLALVAVAALWVAVVHIRKLETASRAQLLVNLEQQITNPEMIKAQAYLHSLWVEAKKTVEQQRKRADSPTHEQEIEEIGKACHQKLMMIRENDEEKYHTLFRNCEFIETIGIMVRQEYVELEDVISRFEVGIERVHTCYHKHLDERRKDSWASQLFFKHIGELFASVRRYRKKQD